MTETGAALDQVLRALDQAGCRYKGGHGQFTAQCPAHEDSNPSLSVRDNGSGKVLVNCHAGCDFERILDVLGLASSDLVDTPPQREQQAAQSHIVATYDYRDADGKVLFQKVRKIPKGFWVRRPDGRGGWVTGIGDAERVLYRLPEVLGAVRDGRTVYVVEGEKDADRAASLGVVATCNFDGAAKAGQRSKWRPAYSGPLRDADVVVVVDNDDAGRVHGRAIASDLHGKAASVRLVRAAVDSKGADLSDHLDAGLTFEDFIEVDQVDTTEVAVAQKPGRAEDPLPDERLTELGHARRLVKFAAGRLKYVPPWRCWLAWDGRRWAEDVTGEAARAAKAVARAVTVRVANELAFAGEDDQQAKASLRAALKLESSSAIRGTLTLAATEPDISVPPDQLDAHPDLLNVANGVVDLATGELLGHDPDLLLTKLAPGAYHPDTPVSSVFLTFLERIQPDPKMRAYLGRLLGYGLLGRSPEHLMPIWYGVGANGKSTLITAVMGTLGDYAITTDPTLLINQGYDSHPTGVADLFGCRLAFTQETDKDRSLAEATVKRLTGGDPIKARRMHRDFFQFDPSHLLIMVTNHLPKVGGDDEGIWRRLPVVPFTVQIPPDERDKDLGAKLAAERNGILAWLVRGHIDWRRRGLVDPEDVVQATADYRQDQDTLGRFLAERCTRIPSATVRSSALFSAWQSWAAAEGVEPGTHKAFSGAVGKRGYESYKSHGSQVWRGIGLLTPEDS